SLSPGVNQGTFYVTNDFGNTTTVAAANALIAGLPASGTYVIHLLHNADSQDFVYGVNATLRKVPEPGPLSLVAVALIALLAVRRRGGAKPAA
ncbi:MAG TPA: PEP-CTERM sorting domain-containing protein, partial [Casimicrobiaceae bacterium]|nr:PEP-CTERM sorting domain-containing protein [Casimicrobiaceae bacterium]